MMWIWALLYLLLTAFLIIYARKALALSKASTSAPSDFYYPSVSVIKPVKGSNVFTKDNFRSWLIQDYPGEIEFIFSFQDPEDSAIPIVKELIQEFPQTSFQILVHPIRQGFSGKTSNLFYAVEASKNDFLVLSDADMWTAPTSVREITLRAKKDKTIVSCLPVHENTGGLWSQMYTTLWNTALTGFWAPLMVATQPPGVSGGTLGFYRSDLEKIGGVPSFASYIVEDIKKGNLFRKAGYGFALGPVIECKVADVSLKQCWNAMLRGAFVAGDNCEGPVGFFKAFPIYLFCDGYVFFPMIYFFSPPAAYPLIFILLLRMLGLGYLNYLCKNKFRPALHTYLCDCMMWIAFIVSLFRRELEWAGVKYRIKSDGRLEKI